MKRLLSSLILGIGTLVKWLWWVAITLCGLSIALAIIWMGVHEWVTEPLRSTLAFLIMAGVVCVIWGGVTLIARLYTWALAERGRGDGW